jgi:transposase
MSESGRLFADAAQEPPKAQEPVRGEPRVLRPNRAQLLLRPTDLESLLPEDHAARAVWEFVTGLDLSPLYAEIQSVEGQAGRPAIDPAMLLTLWVFATVEGEGSARGLERLCEQHDAYRWIAGGVRVSYRTLSEFRVAHEALLDALLTQSVARLMEAGLVRLNRVAQDGMRVRASAGAASYRRRQRLRECLRTAEKQVAALRRELDEDPGASSRREKAARERAAKDRLARVKQALARLKEDTRAHPEQAETRRASTTDPEARVMKMADGGSRPAYNVQLATATESQVVVSRGQHGRHGCPRARAHARSDRRRATAKASTSARRRQLHADTEHRMRTRGSAGSPRSPPRNPDRDPHRPLEDDAPAVARWRRRMGEASAKEKYKERAATAECVNAQSRNRGLDRLLVRGRQKARSIALLFALAHNAMRTRALVAARGLA